MERLYTRIAEPQFLGAPTATVYTNPASTNTYIKSIVMFNSGTTPANVKLYNVPDDGGLVGVAAAVNQFLDVDLVARETFMFDLPYPITMIDAGDTLQGFCALSEAVTIQILGDIAQ